MSKERVEIFSDAVFAIILTLLVLEIRAPDIADHSNLRQYVIAMESVIPKFISFVLTFIIISIYWVNHNYFFQQLRSTPLGIVWLNNLFLLWVCFTPFPTALLGNHPTDQFPILLYDINQFLAAITFLKLRTYATKNRFFLLINR